MHFPPRVMGIPFWRGDVGCRFAVDLAGYCNPKGNLSNTNNNKQK